MGNTYFIIEDSRDACNRSIVSRSSELRVRVYNLDKCSFVPNSHELQMYAFNGTQLLAFETINVKSEDALDMIEAIEFFARHLRNPKMEILPENPRRKRKQIAI